MYIYFCSDYPAVVKLNGKVYKKIYVLPTRIFPVGLNTFIEVCPLIEGVKPISFYPTREYLSTPKSHVSITDLCGGYLLRFIKTSEQSSFNLIFQHKTNCYALSVFNENGTKLSIETPRDFYFENVDSSVERVEIAFFNNNFLGLCFYDKINFICVYNLDDMVNKVFFQIVDDWNYTERLSITRRYNDIAKHVCETTWDFLDGKAVLTNKTITRSPDFHPALCPPQVLAYAFLEELALGGEIDCYLCENIIQSKDKLKGYLGEYIGVCPPPRFHAQDCVGLVFSQDKNLYAIKYLKVELKEGKIFNLSFVNKK